MADKRVLSNTDLMIERWASQNAATTWLRKKKINIEDLGLILAPADDGKGYALVNPKPAAKAVKRPVQAKVAPSAPVAPSPVPEAATPALVAPEASVAATPALVAPEAPVAPPEPAAEEPAATLLPGLVAAPVRTGDFYVSIVAGLDEASARAVCAYIGPRLRCDLTIHRGDGTEVDRIGFAGARPLVNPENITHGEPRRAGTRARGGSKYADWKTQLDDLASRPEGVLRSELNNLLNDGQSFNWKGLLDQIVKGQTRMISVELVPVGDRRYYIRERPAKTTA